MPVTLLRSCLTPTSSPAAPSCQMPRPKHADHPCPPTNTALRALCLPCHCSISILASSHFLTLTPPVHRCPSPPSYPLCLMTVPTAHPPSFAPSLESPPPFRAPPTGALSLPTELAPRSTPPNTHSPPLSQDPSESLSRLPFHSLSYLSPFVPRSCTFRDFSPSFPVALFPYTLSLCSSLFYFSLSAFFLAFLLSLKQRANDSPSTHTRAL